MEMTVANRGARVHITLSGEITESAHFETQRVSHGLPILIDVGDIERINSFGVRKWVSFIKELSTTSPEVVLRRLPPVLTRQAGMVASFLAGASVESVRTPWICLECGYDELHLLQNTDKLPDIWPCPDCNGAMALDDVPQHYEKFLAG